MSTQEVISLAVAIGIAAFITIAGIYITMHGGDWESFWKRQLKQRKAERASRRSLGAEVEEILKEYEESKKKNKFVWFYCVGGVFGFTILVAMFYIIARGIFSDNFIREIPNLVCLSYLGFVAVFTIVHYLFSIRKVRIKKRREVRAEGIIAESTELSTSTSQGIRGNVSMTTRYRLTVVVVSARRVMKALAKIKEGKTIKGRRYARGEKVTVAYDSAKPKRCQIITED